MISKCNLTQKFCTWQVMKLSDEVEDIFVKTFAEEDRRKAMKYLKPHQRKESHSVTFFIGKSPYEKKRNIIIIEQKNNSKWEHV